MDSQEFDALETRAYRRMSPGAAAFCKCGADDEITVRENVENWRGLRLRPRVLQDIKRVDTSVELLGRRHDQPIIVAPMGRHRLFHDEGERATARGAAVAGSCFTLATNSTVLLEDVAAARGASQQWFQLYLPPVRDEAVPLLDRLEGAGFQALVLTVDQPIAGHSPRAMRNPIPHRDDLRHVNLPGQPIAKTNYDPSLSGNLNYPTTLPDVEWLVRQTSMPVIIKGVLRADDAVRCVGAGAKAVIVSNHGGRHLDTSITTAMALPEVASSIGKYVQVFVDGGIRRGTDILKALALGADAVLVGRPILWGLATDGANGVASIITHLRTELERAMALCGVSRLTMLDPDLVSCPRFLAAHPGPRAH
ncbi:MAG: alpha-hydroxy acid oxidase [Hyphomicrobiaceae bacterium]